MFRLEANFYKCMLAISIQSLDMLEVYGMITAQVNTHIQLINFDMVLLLKGLTSSENEYDSKNVEYFVFIYNIWEQPGKTQ